MRRIGLGSMVLVPLLLILAVWLFTRGTGFQISLLGSLGLSVLLTIVLNVVLGAWSRRR